MMKKLLSLSLTVVMMLSCLLSLTVTAAATVDYQNAPYAGVYAVTADKATKVTTEIGSVTELAAGATGYMYLIKGLNNVTVTNNATLTITELKDNGLSYLDQVNIPSEAITPGDGNVYASNLNYDLVPGGKYEFTFNTNNYGSWNGLVYPYIYMSDANDVRISITVNTGFYAELAKSGSQNTWAFADTAGTDFETLYFRKGENQIVITNIGDTTTTLSNINFNSTQPIVEKDNFAHLAAQTGVAHLKPIPYTPQDSGSGSGSDSGSGTERVETSALPGATKIQAEAIASGMSDGDRSVVSLTTGKSMTFNFNATEDTTMDLYLCGSAWKDVSFDITVDGTLLSYETMHFNTPWQGTAVYSQEKVFSFPVSKGSHSIKLYFYTDKFYLDYIALMPHYSDMMMVLNGISNATTANEVYDLLENHGSSLGIAITEETASLHAPETAFWTMVGKTYETMEALYDAYDAILAAEATAPTVSVSGTTATIDGTDLPSNSSLVVCVYEGNKLISVDSAVKSGTKYTATVTGYNSNKTMKVMVMSNLDDLKPHTTDGVYRHYYVSKSGKSSNAGTTPDKPLQTIVQALNKVKSISSKMTGDIIIHVGPGVYRSNVTIAIDPSMGGKNGHNVIIRAEDMNNKPILSGGDPLTGKWTKVDSQNYWVADTSTTDTRALYVNGYQATMANTDAAYKGSAYITPAAPLNDAHDEDGIKFKLSTGFPKGLNGISNMMLVTNSCWAAQRLPIDKITYDSTYAYVYIKQPRYHILLDTVTSTIRPDLNRTYYIENAMPLLNQPGEFYFDKDAKKMYYYPYANEDMTTAETYCAVTDGLIDIIGASATKKVTNISFEGISFRYGAHDQVTIDGAVFNQTDDQWLGGEIWYGSYLFPGQITLDYTDGITFDNCEFTNLGSNAINIEGSSENIRVTNSYFHDISGTGVVVGDFHDNNDVGSAERVHNVEVGNNIFRRCAQEFLGCTAISLYYAGNVNIHHNDIKDLPYSGIVAGWGWGAENPSDVKNNIIAYNRLENTCKVLDDGAHIYTVGRMDNLQINDNYFIDPGTYRRSGLYFDAVTTNTYAADNVFYKANDSGDNWFFARKSVDIDDCAFVYNHSDGKKPSTYGIYAWDTYGVFIESNNLSVSSWSQEAQRIIAEAGIEDKSRLNKIDTYPSWRQLRMNDSVIIIDDI